MSGASRVSVAISLREASCEAGRVPVISREQSEAECDALIQRAVDVGRGMGGDDEIAALRACLDHPCAAHELYVPELWSELAGAYRSAGRLDEAMEAWEQAIAAGYRALPHPRAEIAELLLDAGRRVDADALYAELRDECAGDVWLYNSAGWAYAHGGDHEEALRWLDAGLELALADGDPEDVVDQLADFRQASRKALGRDTEDELASRVETFERSPGPRRSPVEHYGGTESAPVPCEHCGWSPSEERATRMPVGEVKALAAALDRRSSPRSAPIVREKVGRNQACPCGSGRKFKHCHGR